MIHTIPQKGASLHRDHISSLTFFTGEDARCLITSHTPSSENNSQNPWVLRLENLHGWIIAQTEIFHIFFISISPSTDDRTVARYKPAYVYAAVCTSYRMQTLFICWRGVGSLNITTLYLHKKLISFPDTRAQSPSECCSLLNHVLFSYILVFICQAHAYRFANCQD